MFKCAWQRQAERWFDGECAASDAVARHVASCPECAAFLDRLRVLRTGAKAVAVREEIAEPQLPAFIEGLRERIQAPPRHRGAWALVSLTAASLIVAVSVFFTVTVVTGPPRGAAATVVESASTDIRGATVTVSSSEDGTALVWVTEGKGEMW